MSFIQKMRRFPLNIKLGKDISAFKYKDIGYHINCEYLNNHISKGVNYISIFSTPLQVILDGVNHQKTVLVSIMVAFG